MAKVLSIEIGNTLTEIVEMDYKARNPKVYKSLMLSTPEGVLDEGMLYNYENFAHALKKMLKAKGFKAKKVIFSVSSNRIASREVEIPYIKENQIRDFVLANASDYFPVDITEYSISYTVLENLQNEDGGKAIRINALAAPTEMLDSYKEFAKVAGLEIEAIDYDGNSLYQAVKKECSVGSQIVIKIDEKSSIVTVMKDGVQSLTRTVPYGIEEAVDTIIYSHIYSDNTSHSEAISYLRTVKCVNPAFDMEAFYRAREEKIRAQAMAKAEEEAQKVQEDNPDTDQPFGGFGQEGVSSDTEGGAFDFGNNNAESVGSDTENGTFNSEGSNSDDESGTNDNSAYEELDTGSLYEEEEVDPLVKEIRENVTFSFENLVSGLSTVLDLYYSRSKGQKVDRVLITGIGGTIQGIDDLITNTLDVSAQQISTLEGIQLGKVFKNGIFGEYVGCIGAAIKPVDFLIKEKKVKSTGTDITSIARLVLIGCAGAAVLMLAMAVPPYLSAQNTNKDLKNKLKEVVSIIPIYQKYTLSKQAYEYVNLAYELKDEPAAHIVEFIEEMEEKLPADVLVSSMNTDNSTVSITMSVSTKEEAADVYEQFCTFESLQSVTIERITDETSDEGTGLVSFTLVGVYAERTSDEAVTGESTDDATVNSSSDENASENITETDDATEDTTQTDNATDNISNADNSAQNSTVVASDGSTDDDLGDEAGELSTDESGEAGTGSTNGG